MPQQLGPDFSVNDTTAPLVYTLSVIGDATEHGCCVLDAGAAHHEQPEPVGHVGPAGFTALTRGMRGRRRVGDRDLPVLARWPRRAVTARGRSAPPM